MVSSGGGFRKLMEAFDLERCGNATMSLAIAQATLDYVVQYVQERKQVRQAPHRFSGGTDYASRTWRSRSEAARLHDLPQAVWSASEGLPSVKHSSIAKCFANEMVREVAGNELQLMGAYGYSKEFPSEQRLR